MPETLQALTIATVAVLPGAAYTFTVERIVGAFGSTVSDRVIRFIAVSALFHAVFSVLTYIIYCDYIHTGKLANGKISLWLIEITSLAYILIPISCGLFVGTAWRKNWRWVRIVTGPAPAPRAWDHLFARGPQGYIRIKLKSGIWVAGFYGPSPTGLNSYAAGYPSEPDLLVSRTIEVNGATGDFILEDGRPKSRNSALLLRWEEIELLEFAEVI
ncbi:DUF6338 family protein [Protofrankia coriariae]|uniref:DUF6338 family protein n=1 Tax=Protofrankia coriariae TaxID=1562887 RepID=UPI003B846F55